MNYYSNKENDHPNMPKRTKIIESDFNSISKQYVLDGERLKIKSFIYKDQKKVKPKNQMMPMPKEQNMMPMKMEDLTQKDIKKLEYLEQMEVLNKEEQDMLDYIRAHTKRSSSVIPKATTNTSKVMLPQGSNYNTPAYNDQNINSQHYGQDLPYNQQYNEQYNMPPQRNHSNLPSKMYNMPQKHMQTQNMGHYNMHNPQQNMQNQNMGQYNQYSMYSSTEDNSEIEEQSYY